MLNEPATQSILTWLLLWPVISAGGFWALYRWLEKRELRMSSRRKILGEVNHG